MRSPQIVGEFAIELEKLTLRAISARLKVTFRSGYTEDASTPCKLGAFMNRPEYKFDRRRLSSGMAYLVVEVP